ncbi:MAG: PaaI family thioesterase [Gemmatimonadetes bacterium]|nr:PaaI family thioesterase [Gemmatimonadota bacterium]
MSDHYRKLENAYLLAPINAFYKPSISVGEAKATISIALRQELWHAAFAVHGSVYFKMLDDAAFFAANSLVEDRFVLTASFNIYLTRPVAEGTIRSEGTVTSRSRRLILAEARLFDDQDREIGRGSGSFMPSRIPLGPDIGYRLSSEGDA